LRFAICDLQLAFKIANCKSQIANARGLPRRSSDDRAAAPGTANVISIKRHDWEEPMKTNMPLPNCSPFDFVDMSRSGSSLWVAVADVVACRKSFWGERDFSLASALSRCIFVGDCC
jgi:hypothetical protein